MAAVSLFDEQLQPSGAALRDEALARVDDAADPEWKDVARELVLSIEPGIEFTTDRVWSLLDERGATTHEPRALGAIMRALALRGEIENTKRYQPSSRPECHARPIPTWRRR